MNSDRKEMTQQAHLWLAQIDDGPLNSEQQQAFEQWLNTSPQHTILFAEAEMMWHGLSQPDVKQALTPLLEPPQASRRQTGWQTISEKWNQIRYSWPLLTGTLAATALVFLLWFSPSPPAPVKTSAPQMVQYQTDRGQSRLLRLNDGSQITLAPGSLISVQFSRQVRQVTLDHGSAFFQISHHPIRPFIVTSGGAEVVVTGTEFDVRRKKNSVYVAVEKGAVDVSLALPNWQERSDINQRKPWQRRPGALLSKVSLSAGQEVKAHRLSGLGQVAAIPQGMLGAWRKGKLIYINEPLEEIVEDINRFSSVPVILAPSADQLKVSGTFHSHDIPGMLTSLEAALPIHIEHQANQVNIKLNPPKTSS